MKDGAKNYIKQRLSALVLIPIVFWFVFSVLHLIKHNNVELFVLSPWNLVITVIFAFAFAVHAIAGMQSIVDDYVSCKIMRKSILIMLYIFTMVSALLAIVAIASLHFAII